MWLHAVRQPAFAGSWYPRDAKELDAALGEALAQAPEPKPGTVVAMLAPYSSPQYAGRVTAAAFRAASASTYERIVLLADAEASFRGLALPNVEAFGSPLGAVPVDREAVEALARLPDFSIRLAAFDDCYQIENLIPWIRKVFPSARIVPVVVGSLPRPRRAAAAASLRTVLGDHALLIASSDLSYDLPESPLAPGSWNGGDIPAMVERSRRFDTATLSLLLERRIDALEDRLVLPGAICAPKTAKLFAMAMPEGVTGETVSYDTSATYEQAQDMTVETIIGFGAAVFRTR